MKQNMNIGGKKQILCLFLVALLLSQGGFASKKEVVFLDLHALHQTDLNDSTQVLDMWDALHCASTLQGIVNRTSPRLYVRYVTSHGIDIDSHWWNIYRRKGEWLHAYDSIPCNRVEDAVATFRSCVKGAVVYDSNVPSTSNVASSVAGAENLIALRYDPRPQSLYSRLVLGESAIPVKCWLVNPDGSSMFTGKGMLPGCDRPSSGSVKCDPYLWFIEKYMKTGRCKGRYAGYYIDQYWRNKPRSAPMNHHLLSNHDFFVSKGGFFFDLSPWADEPATDEPSQPLGTDAATLSELLSQAYRLGKGKEMCYIGGFPAWAYKYTRRAGGLHEDVATEWQFSEFISHYNAFKDADAIGYGAMANASFWQHFPLKKTYPQKWVEREQLVSRGLISADGQLAKGKNFIVVYVGDYDASSWVSQCLPRLWDAPERGRLPMMWAISPVLAQRAPHVLHYLRQTASHNDYFVSADNGAGYLMPGTAEYEDSLQGTTDRVRAWERHCQRFYRQWGIDITGFIIDGNGPAMGTRSLDAYSRFSPRGIVPQKCPPASLYKGMPVLRSDWDLVSNDPKVAAQVLVDRIRDRGGIPFHWFRCILKSPKWYEETIAEAKRLNPSIELLDAPSFFELLKWWLETESQSQTPAHAKE